MKHIVYGNGESRKVLSHNEWTTTWGCNAAYRDLGVDNLVSVDYNMQQEIYESNYAMKNNISVRCHDVKYKFFDKQDKLQEEEILLMFEANEWNFPSTDLAMGFLMLILLVFLLDVVRDRPLPLDDLL